MCGVADRPGRKVEHPGTKAREMETCCQSAVMKCLWGCNITHKHRAPTHEASCHECKHTETGQMVMSYTWTLPRLNKLGESRLNFSFSGGMM